jgi:hypothetical protein
MHPDKKKHAPIMHIAEARDAVRMLRVGLRLLALEMLKLNIIKKVLLLKLTLRAFLCSGSRFNTITVSCISCSFDHLANYFIAVFIKLLSFFTFNFELLCFRNRSRWVIFSISRYTQ